SEVPLALKGDSHRLGQILINLISNAVKFTDRGEILIKVEVHKECSEPFPGPDHVDLLFSVQDSGPGISQEEQDVLFEPFSQLDGSLVRKHEGTGLGLSICHRLANLMGGQIWLESELGCGSTFYFNLILNRGSAEKTYQLIAPVDIRGLNVMVVDDNETARYVLKQMLNQFQFDVTLADSGKKGLAELERAAAKKPYDLLIVDWKMPEMDGFEMAGRIRNHPVLGEKANSPKIIMNTMYGRTETLEAIDGKNDIIDGYMFKPINSSEMFRNIMEVFGETEAIVSRMPLETQPVNTIGIEGIRGARILLVEDHKINQQVAISILMQIGVVVEVAENGREAVDRLKTVADTTEPFFDAVLMDIEMPVMDGFEATRRIREWKAQSS
ncbi:MAG: response regulator, partial [Gammaproteobacteria bacterium]|nr:response regulator [Gammaproteobacteria bacterium]